MRRIIEADEQFEKINLGIEEAIAWAKQNEQPYKLELLMTYRGLGQLLLATSTRGAWCKNRDR